MIARTFGWREASPKGIDADKLEIAMEKDNPPETLGVFKPVGHTVITYRSAQDRELAAAALAAQGVAGTDLTRYSGPEMVALADDQERAVARSRRSATRSTWSRPTASMHSRDAAFWW